MRQTLQRSKVTGEKMDTSTEVVLEDRIIQQNTENITYSVLALCWRSTYSCEFCPFQILQATVEEKVLATS